jgi:hypothetical protein
VHISENALYFAVSLPNKGLLLAYSFDKVKMKAVPNKEIFEPLVSSTIDDFLSQALFLSPSRKKVNHHTLLWNFDVSRVDHKTLGELSRAQKVGEIVLDPRVMRSTAAHRERELQRGQNMSEDSDDRLGPKLLVIKIDSAAGL